MNWKLEATNKLEKLKLLRNAVQTLPTEIQRLEDDLQSLNSPDPGGIHVQDSQSRSEERIFSNLAQRHELKQLLKQTRRWIWFTEQGLNALSADERFLLEKMYVDRPDNAVELLCQELMVERSTVYRRLEQALRSFTLALYTATESG